jgi:hypothetical protein
LKTIIAGIRDLEIFKDRERIWVVADAVMKSGWRDQITEVFSGGARGIDLAGELWANTCTPPIPIRRFIPDWNGLGKIAGFVRNAEMATYADALILIWDGMSSGSANMKKEAKKREIKIYEYIVK